MAYVAGWVSSVFLVGSLAQAQTNLIRQPTPGPDSPLKQIPGWIPGQFIQLNGIRLYYETYGPASSSNVVLLLHGGTASIESFFNQIPVLAKNYRVIAPDSRGQGRTQDSDQPITYDSMAADMVALLHHLQLANVNVVGWSDGGIIALDMAMHHPELVKKLVAIGTNYRVDGTTEDFRTSVKTNGPNDHLPFLIDNYKQLTPDGSNHWPVVYGKLQSMWLNSPNFSEQDLAKVSCPALIMIGDHDIIKPEHSVRLYQILPKGQLCVVPNASHFGPVEKPELVNGIILTFLGEDATQSH